jgi:hypothetical protein
MSSDYGAELVTKGIYLYLAIYKLIISINIHSISITVCLTIF